MKNLIVYDVYTNGSWNNGIWGAGAVILSGDRVIKEISFGGADTCGSKNVAGEIQSVLTALRFLFKFCKATCKYGDEVQVNIHHDYIGLSAWACGDWKTKEQDSIEYKKSIDSARKYFDIKFIKVSAHSGNHYNESADFLAKKGVESFKSTSQTNVQSTSKQTEATQSNGLTIPKNISAEALNLVEQVLTMVQEQITEKVQTSSLEEQHTFLRVNEIDSVIENVRYQFECEAEA